MIIILESQWNLAVKSQIIGRGSRRHSHHHLPPDQRTLQVYQMVLTYPNGKSADELIQKKALLKSQKCDELLQVLKQNQ
jgi:hypothetical protein